MLKLRWPGVCRVCGTELPAGSTAEWDTTTRKLSCTACLDGKAESAAPASPATSSRGPDREPRGAAARREPEPSATSSEFDRGRPGASVSREYRRRKSSRETRTRASHPHIGGLLLALSGSPRHESAFHQGELGERAVAESLERRTARGPAIILHDRRMPRGRGNIDHLAIAPAGVFVIDAKNIRGKVRVANPLFGNQRLLISGRDRTRLIDGLDRQVAAVRTALAANGEAGVPVQGVLCFTTADLPLLGTLKMRGHLMLHRRALAKRLNASGPLDALAIETLARALAGALAPA
jgi:hypothetical protein